MLKVELLSPLIIYFIVIIAIGIYASRFYDGIGSYHPYQFIHKKEKGTLRKSFIF